MIGVAVAGAAGRMGETVCAAVTGAADMELVDRADPLLDRTLQQVLDQGRAEVVVDFTRPDTALENTLACVRAGVHVVVGTTGFEIESLKVQLAQIEAGSEPPSAPASEAQSARADEPAPPSSQTSEPAPSSSRANVFIAPNFAIGAVLMMRFAVEAARYMSKVEIVELHHDRKLDAPSGTAALTAQLIAEASGNPQPPIHSVRLPGIVANQEVIFGDVGQTLTIRHDTTGRESFMPGVLLAIRGVRTLQSSPVVGLEQLM